MLVELGRVYTLCNSSFMERKTTTTNKPTLELDSTAFAPFLKADSWLEAFWDLGEYPTKNIRHSDKLLVSSAQFRNHVSET